MSYDIDFWRYQEGVRLNDQKVYERLSNGQHVEGLEALPIPAITAAVRAAFLDWEHPDEETWDGGERGTFQIFTTAQFFRFDLYGVDDSDADRLIEIAKSFGCPVYDPQKGKRLDGA